MKGGDNLLRSVVIYGPNAAGKTNLLRTAQFMQSFVVRSAAAGGAQYAYTPFRLARAVAGKPSAFEMSFIQDDMRYDYPLSDFRPRNDEVLEDWYMRGCYRGGAEGAIS
ncbi:MAG: ATP-binding protein [Enhydrobacter sp.]|nr:MAG: ATP-binding protein [Enhydrobacter sp.]